MWSNELVEKLLLVWHLKYSVMILFLTIKIKGMKGMGDVDCQLYQRYIFGSIVMKRKTRVTRE